MEDKLTVIAHIRTDFPEKFGLPRQAGLVRDLKGYIEFEPDFCNPDAIRGIEGYEYLWILWKFEVKDDGAFKATVRPPRLGGNERMGVFATRSPFRPNHIGLSSVKLDEVKITEKGPVLYVSGIDMKDMTPIYDIKPYLTYTDSHEGARSGFTDEVDPHSLEVDFPKELLSKLPEDKRTGVIDVLAGDIRPSYHEGSSRSYGLSYGGFNIRFNVEENRLTVTDVERN